ncbi:Sugar phosphate isomerase/epimerase [Mesorhizobium albiziae]|uniref:Sugar phosphate isomerase/epimerase n=1 Tax=Neomesorhizobium albiziae TaxID=335020 RepID=A0A1I3WMI2_9HYPH|nr:sugar phosphate isomerase/epimerase [Mesorhizobium albiziae]GLS31764.1 xylose isomerase [Mesorhizobium albiziae]SFK08914.1 Sugar phosphate isomerase/epimerase [Mesorhizobium albiziae]
MDWSFQLYSARNFQPWDKVLETLGMIGYKNVEGFGGLYDDPARLRATLDRNGLAMPSGHFSLDMLENDFDKALGIVNTLGMKLVACPHITEDLRPSDAAGWRGFGQRLGKIGARFKGTGIGFGWHNHDFEFVRLADGSVPQQHILDAAPDIGWEIDVAWVIRGGADPKEWIEKYGPRIVAVHVKDIATAGQNQDQDGWADVGHGTVDWKGLYKLLRDKTPAKFFVMEHDNPSDATRFARLSYAAAQNF